MKKELSKEGIDKAAKKSICNRFLGCERDGVRSVGLVDLDSEEAFDAEYNSMKCNLPEKFVKWLETEQGRTRPLIESMKKCMLKPVRINAGLGNPPNQWENNMTECLHNVIKEELNHESVDVTTFLEKVKECVFDQQRDEYIRGIHGLGEYRLIDQKKHLQVSPVQWSEMTETQRKALAAKVLHSDVEVEKSKLGSQDLSVSFSALKCCSNIPLYTLKNIWATAEFIVGNYIIQEMAGGNFCVPDTTFGATVIPENNYGLKCTCKQYINTSGLCAHVLAVAEKNGFIREFIQKYDSKKININKVIAQAVPKRAGDKPQQKKPRRGKNNVIKHPITELHQSEVTEILDQEIDLPKAKKFTEYYHNNEKFLIMPLSDEQCKRAKSCISCKLVFPKDNPSCPDSDIVVLHKERYERPVKDDKGKFVRMTISNQMGRKFYCLKKKCILLRHPYFWKGLIEIPQSSRAYLNNLHEEFILDELHFKV